MPPIFINTDNSDKTKKIFIANLAGAASAEAEDKMKAMVIKAFEKVPDFTTNNITDPKGYTLMLKVTKFAADRETSCTITGEILRYPKAASKSKQSDGSGTETVMFGGTWGGSATASGKGKSAVIDCVEAILEGMIPKSIPVMKADMNKR